MDHAGSQRSSNTTRAKFGCRIEACSVGSPSPFVEHGGAQYHPSTQVWVYVFHDMIPWRAWVIKAFLIASSSSISDYLPARESGKNMKVYHHKAQRKKDRTDADSWSVSGTSRRQCYLSVNGCLPSPFSYSVIHLPIISQARKAN